MKVRVGDIEVFYLWDGPAEGPTGGSVEMMAHALGTGHRIRDRPVPALADRYRLLR